MNHWFTNSNRCSTYVSEEAVEGWAECSVWKLFTSLWVFYSNKICLKYATLILESPLTWTKLLTLQTPLEGPESQILLYLWLFPSPESTTSDLFTVSTTFHFLECHRILWPVHLFILSGAKMPLYQHISLFTHSPHGCLQFWIIKVSINIHVHAFIWTNIFNLRYFKAFCFIFRCSWILLTSFC